MSTLSHFQKHFADLLQTLGTSIDMKVTEPMVNFTKEEIPATIAIKKKWDSARKDYDSSITKVVVLQKEKKPNPPKITLAEQERERMKTAYLAKGDEAYKSLLETNEISEYETLEKLLTFVDSYYQFFRGGYQFLREVHENVVIKERQWIAEQRFQFEKRPRNISEWIPDSISGGATAKTRMFGMPYEELIRRDQPASLIPVWLEKAIEFLEMKALGIQGVFRVSPPKTQLDDTKKKIDAAHDIDWSQLDEHVCTGAVKLFLRELPQPLLTFELYSKFVSAGDIDDDLAKVKAIKAVLTELPKPNFSLLKRLLALMVLIERNKDVNKMTSSNLAVVLCPSILYPEVPDPLTMVDDIQRANRVMSVFITHYADVFGTTVTGPSINPSAVPASVLAGGANANNSNSPSKSVSFASSQELATNAASQASANASSSSSATQDAKASAAKKTAPPIPHKSPLTASGNAKGVPNASNNQNLNTSTPTKVEQGQNTQKTEPAKNSGAATPSTAPNPNFTAATNANNAANPALNPPQVAATAAAGSGPNSAASTPPSSLTLSKSPSGNNITASSGIRTSTGAPGTTENSNPNSSAPAPSQVAAPQQEQVVFPSNVVPSVDAGQKIDLETMKLILQEKAVGSTFDYFMSIQELADANAAFASLVLTVGLQNGGNVSNQPSGAPPTALRQVLNVDLATDLNGALKNLAKSIKNILASVREFSSRLPPELRNRMLMAAKELQDRVLSTAGAFKEYNENAHAGATAAVFASGTKLVDSTRHFVASVFAIAARFKEFSLVDELISSSSNLARLCEELEKSFFAENSATNIAICTNSLQSASFKLTALLRSKILDSASQTQISSLAACIESAEKETRDICESVKAMLFDESLNPEDIKISPQISAAIKSLAETAKKAENFFEVISPAQNASVSNALLFAPTIDQLSKNIATHSSNNHATMASIVANLKTALDIVSNQLKPTWNDLSSYYNASSPGYNHEKSAGAAQSQNKENSSNSALAFDTRSKWIDQMSSLTSVLTNIGAITQKIIDEPSIKNDPAATSSLTAYIHSLSSMALLLKITATAEAYEVQSCSDSLPRSISVLKDFVFISFPVLFNINDSLSLIEEEKNAH